MNWNSCVHSYISWQTQSSSTWRTPVLHKCLQRCSAILLHWRAWFVLHLSFKIPKRCSTGFKSCNILFHVPLFTLFFKKHNQKKKTRSVISKTFDLSTKGSTESSLFLFMWWQICILSPNWWKEILDLLIMDPKGSIYTTKQDWVQN